MPYVNIKITREGATTEQKAELIKGVTDLLTKILGKNPTTTVVFAMKPLTKTAIAKLLRKVLNASK